MKCHPEVLALFKLADSLTERMVRVSQLMSPSKPIVCAGPGCTACCKEPVYADKLEIDHALGRATPEVRKRIRARVQTWLDKVVPSGLLDVPAPNVFEWRALNAWCPCLEDGKCMIYKDRPVACRQHLASGSPEGCVDDEMRKKQEFLSSPEVDRSLAMAVLSSRSLKAQDNMGVWLAEILLGKKVESRARKII